MFTLIKIFNIFINIPEWTAPSLDTAYIANIASGIRGI